MSLFGRLRGRRRPHWDEDRRRFPGMIDEESGLWDVDLGVVSVAPVPELEYRLDVWLRYQAGTEGLPEEQHRLDRLAAAVGDAAVRLGGVYVGWVASRGGCRFTAHLPAAPVTPVELAGWPEAAVSVEYDPHWAFVRDSLAPDERQRQYLADLVFVRYLAGQGDVLTSARAVEHTAVFTDLPAAEEAAGQLRAEGFDVLVERDDEGDRALTAVRVDPVAPPAVHDMSWSVREIVERHGGGYGGWACLPVS
jgi:hypothetical protein